MRRTILLSILLHTILFAIYPLRRLIWRPPSPPPKLLPLEILPPRIARKAPAVPQRQLADSEIAPDKQPPNPKDKVYLGERTQWVTRPTINLGTQGIQTGIVRRDRALPNAPATQSPHLSPPPRNVAKPEERKQALLTLTPLRPHRLALGMASLPTERRPSAPEYAPLGTQRADPLIDAAEGTRTLLNTQEYVYFAYYHRIRERLEMAWVPLLRKKVLGSLQQGRRIASQANYSTVVVVSLDVRGEIIRVSVQGPSGTLELDEAAVEAFNQAGPFPNPPVGMFQQKRSVDIPWEFILRT